MKKLKNEALVGLDELPEPNLHAPKLPPAHERKRRRDESLALFTKRLKAEKDEAINRWKQHVALQAERVDINAKANPIINYEVVQDGKWGKIHPSHRRAILKGDDLL